MEQLCLPHLLKEQLGVKFRVVELRTKWHQTYLGEQDTATSRPDTDDQPESGDDSAYQFAS